MTDRELLESMYKILLDNTSDIKELKTEMKEVKADIQTLKTEMKEVKADIQTLNTKMKEVNKNISELNSRMKEAEANIQVHETEMRGIREDLQALTCMVDSIHITLDNVTNKNIKLIAEGHLDLTRKLSDAMRVEDEKEMLLVKVNIIENDVRIIKSKLEIA